MTRTTITISRTLRGHPARMVLHQLERLFDTLPGQVLVGVELDRDAAGRLLGATMTAYQAVEVVSAGESDAAWAARLGEGAPPVEGPVWRRLRDRRGVARRDGGCER